MVGYQDYTEAPWKTRTDTSWWHTGDLQRVLTMGREGQAGEARLAAESLFRTRAEGIRGEQEVFEGELERSFAAQGIDPTVARRQIAERRSAVPGRLAGARGEAEVGLHTQLGSIIREDTESRVSVGMFGKNLAYTEYARQQAERERAKNRKLGTIGSVIGLGLTGLGMWGMSGGGPFAGLGGPGATQAGYAMSPFAYNQQYGSQYAEQYQDSY